MSGLLNGSDTFSIVVQSGFRKLLVNGMHIYIWDDIWVADGKLKDLFPRIYALTVNKTGMVHKFGQWIDGIWSWNIELRRLLFD